jgi:hypothetical protein
VEFFISFYPSKNEKKEIKAGTKSPIRRGEHAQIKTAK